MLSPESEPTSSRPQTPSAKIEGANDNWGKFEEDLPKVKFPPELEPHVTAVEQFIDHNSPLFGTILGRSDVRFRPDTGYRAYFKPGIIGVDVNQWREAEENNISTVQRLFGACHEIREMKRLFEDPKGLQREFGHIEKKAQELVPEVRRIWTEREGQLPAHITDKFIERFLYQQYHTLYNCVGDIYVNRGVARDAARFAEGSANQAEVERYYRDYLFSSKKSDLIFETETAIDFSKLPRSHQFAYALIRQTMVPSQKVLVSPEVRAALDKKVTGGATVAETVDLITRPSEKYAREPHNETFRNGYIGQYVEPEFDKLLLADIKDMPLPSKAKGGEGGGEGEPGEPTDEEGESGEEGKEGKESEKGQKGTEDKDKKGEGSDPWQELDKKSPIDKETVDQFLREKREADRQQRKEERESRLSPDEKAKRARAEVLRRVCQENGIPPEIANEYIEIAEKVAPYRREVSHAFHEMFKQIRQMVETEWAEGYKSGRIDIQKFVRRYGKFLQEGAEHLMPFDKLTVYERREFINKFKIFPDKVRIDLVEDSSGSMDDAKRTALKMITVLTLESADLFEREINEIFDLQKKVRVDTQVWIFGNQGASECIKPLRSASGYNDQVELVNRLRMFGQLSGDRGSTWDADPWALIAESIGEAERRMIAQGKLRSFGCEITDGGSDDPQATRNAVASAEEKGIVARAFQVGETSEGEKASFDQVWGIDPRDNRPRGQKIENLAELAPAFTALFIEQMRQNVPVRLEAKEK